LSPSAASRLTDGIRPGVIQLPTGACYDPEDPDEDALLCVHGNPNVLTRDVAHRRSRKAALAS
jgi:biotin/methionine sulfoxide reductase